MQAHGDRVLEGRARRADRGRPVRRRPQAPPAAGRLRVGAGRPADHLRPQALQRRARLPGPAGPGDLSAASRSCALLRKEALAECTDEPETHVAERTREPPATRQRRRARARPKRPCRRPRNPRETNPSRRAAHGELWEVAAPADRCSPTLPAPGCRRASRSPTRPRAGRLCRLAGRPVAAAAGGRRLRGAASALDARRGAATSW